MERSFAILQQFQDVLNMTLTEIEHKLCSAMVESVGRALGRSHKNLPVLADVIMCIYLSDLVHNKLRDYEGESQQSGRQYAVLVGDYWLSESFLQMISHEIYAQLRPLTDLVKSMKKGALLRWKLTQKQAASYELPLVWERERGLLVALCGRLAAEVLGADVQSVRLFERFGRCLGMAWAAKIEDKGQWPLDYAQLPTPESFLTEADALIGELDLICDDVTALVRLRDFIADQFVFLAGEGGVS
ncbi:MAG: hypothetical protein FWG14_02405 [Peptococcaceae bacterium]|nr:hypothetical protein [Peptococcaceae bacterium]